MSDVQASTLSSPQLCLITDPDLPVLAETVEEALAVGVTMLQVRGHRLTAAELYRLVLKLRPLCRCYGIVCIVNDRLDVGLATQADGFQLGVRSLPLPVARRLAGANALLGASVHTVEEARAAANDGADFLLAGTIFPSRSHPGEPVGGVELLRAIREVVPGLPLLAVGGITEANAWQVMAAGASGIAVISAILRAPSISDAVARLRAAIGLEPLRRSI